MVLRTTCYTKMAEDAHAKSCLLYASQMLRPCSRPVLPGGSKAVSAKAQAEVLERPQRSPSERDCHCAPSGHLFWELPLYRTKLPQQPGSVQHKSPTSAFTKRRGVKSASVLSCVLGRGLQPPGWWGKGNLTQAHRTPRARTSEKSADKEPVHRSRRSEACTLPAHSSRLLRKMQVVHSLEICSCCVA